MSILANLLKKAETSHAKGDIPPGLLQAARSSSYGDANLKKYLALGGLAVAAVAVGGGLAIYMSQRQLPHQPIVKQSVPHPAAAIQKPVSTAPPVQLREAAASTPKAQATPVKAKTTSKKAVHQQQALRSVKQAPMLPAKRAAGKEAKPFIRDRAAIDALLFAARSAELRRDYAAALKQYQAALEADPQNYRIMNNAASTMLQLGLNEQALGLANRALARKPDYPSAMVNAGIALGRTGSEQAARSMFVKALVLEPMNRAALYSLALSQERAGLLDDALNSYRRLSDTGDARGLLGQGRLYERRGDKEDALRLYREVLVPPEVGQYTKDLARERIRTLEQ